MARKVHKMKWYTKLWAYPLLLVNLAVSAVFIVCAYSPHIPAERFPVISLAGLAFPFAFAAMLAFLVFWLFFYRRFCWLSVVTLLVCCKSIYAMSPLNITDTRAPKESLKLLSYNIHSGNIKPGVKMEDNLLLSYLGDSEADIICMQECNYNGMMTLEGVADWMKRYPYRSYRVSSENTNSGLALSCISRYPILSVETIKFSGSGNGIAQYRIALDADTLTLFNCHLQSFGLDDGDKSMYENIINDPSDNLRTAGTRKLVRKLRDAAVLRAIQADTLAARVSSLQAADPDATILVCGDFNDSPISYAHHRLTHFLTDAYTHSGNGPGFSYTHNYMYFRIDHILCSPNLRPYACRVDKSMTESDHFPITASFVRRKN